jgi:hypothetical protein
MKLKRSVFLTIALATGLVATPAFASGIDASGVLTSKPAGGDFDYSITLTNSNASPNPIGTFWFGWVPGKDFLPTAPFDITAPTGWVEQVTHGGATDGFAIQFIDKTGPLLAPGSSLSGFGFTSADTPAQLAGSSPFYPGTPATTSFVYNGAPFSTFSDQFVVSVESVPEPSSLILGLFGAVTSFGYLLLKKRKGTA